MDIITSLSALKETFDIVKSAIDVKDDTKIKIGIAEFADKYVALQSTVMELQQKNLDLLNKKVEVDKEFNKLKNEIAEREKYSLYEICKGSFVYKYNLSDKPEHYLCQNCYDKGIKSILRLQGEGQWYGTSYICAESAEHRVAME